MENEQKQHKLAVLIDADNTPPYVVEPLIAEIAKFGVASVKRIYGDWTSPHLKGWKEVLLHHAIHPIQQFGYTTGKNATDSAMIIDAMDLLYTRRFDGFCIVSSDSDFTRLASRIREAGLTVYGFGKQMTPKAFVSACDKFIFIEILTAQDVAGSKAPTESKAVLTPKSARQLKADKTLVKLLTEALDAVAADDGWANLGPIGQHITNQVPSFDPRNYGYKKFSELIEAIGLFDVDERQPFPGARHRDIYIRHKTTKRRKGKKS